MYADADSPLKKQLSESELRFIYQLLLDLQELCEYDEDLDVEVGSDIEDAITIMTHKTDINE